MCIRAHETSLLHEDVTEDRVNQVVRIATVVQGFVVAVGAARVGGAST
jgi:hypothetical protein